MKMYHSNIPAVLQTALRIAAETADPADDPFFAGMFDLVKMVFDGFGNPVKINPDSGRIAGKPERLGETGYFLTLKAVRNKMDTGNGNHFANHEAIVQKLEDLNRDYQHSFLHYTPDYPDHWICPQNQKRGFTDLPHNGGVLAICNLIIMFEPESRDACKNNIILPYAEFLAAMLPRIPEKELKYALLFLSTAAFCIPEQMELITLTGAVLARCTGKTDPEILSPYHIPWGTDNEPGRSVFS